MAASEVITLGLECLQKPDLFCNFAWAEDQVITHLLSEVAPEFVYLLWTPEGCSLSPLNLIEKTEARYGLRVEILRRRLGSGVDGSPNMALTCSTRAWRIASSVARYERSIP